MWFKWPECKNAHTGWEDKPRERLDSTELLSRINQFSTICSKQTRRKSNVSHIHEHRNEWCIGWKRKTEKVDRKVRGGGWRSCGKVGHRNKRENERCLFRWKISVSAQQKLRGKKTILVLGWTMKSGPIILLDITLLCLLKVPVLYISGKEKVAVSEI